MMLEIKRCYFGPTLEAYKILKERDWTSLIFLFYPTSFHAAGEYIVICAKS